MIKTILGQKLEMTQDFTRKGARIPLTKIIAGPCPILRIKTLNKDGYRALQVGFGQKKCKTLTKPQYTREIRVKNPQKYQVGDQILVSQVLRSGDKVKITGFSKGKGFTGVIKRWGFAGGPRTHGQSDRERAPGSIGQGTTPGRVRKGKKMPGRAGGKKSTIKNLQVFAVDKDKNQILVKGSVPGSKKGFLIITKTGKVKKPNPLP